MGKEAQLSDIMHDTQDIAAIGRIHGRIAQAVANPALPQHEREVLEQVGAFLTKKIVAKHATQELRDRIAPILRSIRIHISNLRPLLRNRMSGNTQVVYDRHKFYALCKAMEQCKITPPVVSQQHDTAIEEGLPYYVQCSGSQPEIKWTTCESPCLAGITYFDTTPNVIVGTARTETTSQE